LTDYGSYRNLLGVPGDLLYVRETWRCEGHGEHGQFTIRYRADNETNGVKVVYEYSYMDKWRPSIHMPKWAARTWLRVTGVRVERVQDITEEDCIAEGIISLTPPGYRYKVDGKVFSTGRLAFAALWDSIYDKRGLGWDVNPWVWVTSYEVIER